MWAKEQLVFIGFQLTNIEEETMETENHHTDITVILFTGKNCQ